MLEITRSRERVETVDYWLDFKMPDGREFSFPCDKDGLVREDNLPPVARENYFDCLKHAEEYHYTTSTNSYIEPAEGVCTCGETVVLYDPMTNVCERCGRYYNGYGQELNPPHMWEEDY